MSTVRLKLMAGRVREKALIAGVYLGVCIVNERWVMLRWEKFENDLRHMNAILRSRPSR